MGILVAEAVEEDLGRPVGNVVAVGVGDEEEVGCGADPDAAMAEFEAADEIQILGEDLAGLEGAVAVGIGEDDEAVEALALGTARGIAVGLRDPEATPFVDGERDGLADLGFGGDQFGAKTRGYVHLGDGLGTGTLARGGNRIRDEVAQDGAGAKPIHLGQGDLGAGGGGVGGGGGQEEQAQALDQYAPEPAAGVGMHAGELPQPGREAKGELRSSGGGGAASNFWRIPGWVGQNRAFE